MSIRVQRDRAPPAQQTRSNLLPSFASLCIHSSTHIDGTSKRKANGDLAETRLGKVVSTRWLNERFREVMMLVHEFRSEWPNQSLLSNDDVEVMRRVSTIMLQSALTLVCTHELAARSTQVIRMTIDTALATAEREGHVGDIYDMNATAYTIWLIQHAYAMRNGGWTAMSEQQQRQWSFESLYRWLEVQHARGVMRYLYDPSTRQLLHRYKLPFKANMRIPPAKTERFKWFKGAKRLSDWMESGDLEPIDTAIQNQLSPALVAPPPLQSHGCGEVDQRAADGTAACT